MVVLSENINGESWEPNLRFQVAVVDAFSMEHLKSLQNLFRDLFGICTWPRVLDVCTEVSILDILHNEICTLQVFVPTEKLYEKVATLDPSVRATYNNVLQQTGDILLPTSPKLAAPAIHQPPARGSGIPFSHNPFPGAKRSQIPRCQSISFYAMSLTCSI